jgi:hypothetical protein
MRLIDADKLKDRQFAIGDGDTHAVEAVVSLDDIDAQPVIACKTCKHYDDNFYCRRKGEKYWVIRHDDFGCAFYDQKEQP